MKKIIYLAVMLVGLSASATTPPEISEKVLKAFNETFTLAKNVTWNEMENSCQANFDLSEIRVKAVYDNDGNLLQTVRYYSEKNLPPNIIAKLKKKYADKKVLGVTEITSDREVAFHITLNDAKHYYQVKSDAYGNIDLKEKFKRAD